MGIYNDYSRLFGQDNIKIATDRWITLAEKYEKYNDEAFDKLLGPKAQPGSIFNGLTYQDQLNALNNQQSQESFNKILEGLDISGVYTGNNIEQKVIPQATDQVTSSGLQNFLSTKAPEGMDKMSQSAIDQWTKIYNNSRSLQERYSDILSSQAYTTAEIQKLRSQAPSATASQPAVTENITNNNYFTINEASDADKVAETVIKKLDQGKRRVSI